MALPKKKQEEKKNKRCYTARQLKTKEILHEIIAEYDKLASIAASQPTAANKKRMETYEAHLRSSNQLTMYFLSYISQNDITGTLVAEGRIRSLVKSEIDAGALIYDDKKRIRIPKNIPYDSVSATSTTITIMLPTQHVDTLVDYLNAQLINEAVHIFVPCSNMILIVETGPCAYEANQELFSIASTAIMTFSAEHNLAIPFRDSTTFKFFIE